jgi:hypothetical protein
MKENITAIQEFLTRGELRLNSDGTIYQILSINADGQADAFKDPVSRRDRVKIKLAEEEIAELASLCFPPKAK